MHDKDYLHIKKWYFVSKIVLTYCEKKMFKGLRKTFEIRGWRQEFPNILRSIEKFIQTEKGISTIFETEWFFYLFLEVSQI